MSTFGIDLGTTYSCIATLDRNGNPEVIANQADGTDTLASAVYFESADNAIVGAAAKDYLETDGNRVVQFVKREIGKKDGKTYEFDGKTYTPVEISALILKRLVQIAEEQGYHVEDVVITCPAYFANEERIATMAAGKLAGLNVIDIINEPTAAALSYCARQFQEERTIMVYDLGGGTFDVTIIKMSMETNANGQEVQKIKILNSNGNDRLGGMDWDELLFSHILQACCDDNSILPEEIDAETRQAIRSKVETTKRKLSSAESAKVKVNINGSITTVTVTREEFEQLTAGKVAQTMNYVDYLLKETEERYGHLDIDTVLLVGGSTLMPMIRQAVEARFPGKVQLEDPHRAVAKGAAIFASMLVDDSSEPMSEPGPNSSDTKNNPGTDTGNKAGIGTIFEDQISRSFGPGVILKRDGKELYMIDNLLKRGDVSPASKTKTYYTLRDNQPRILLRAFENMCLEDMLPPCVDSQGNEQPTNPAHAVKLLGDLSLQLPPNTPKGSPIEVTFEASQTGIYVKAVNATTGESADVTLKTESDVDFENSPTHDIAISGE